MKASAEDKEDRIKMQGDAQKALEEKKKAQKEKEAKEKAAEKEAAMLKAAKSKKLVRQLWIGGTQIVR